MDTHNKSLQRTLVNVAKIHEYNHLFRVERAVQGRGAPLNSAVRPVHAILYGRGMLDTSGMHRDS